jgi:hypothetical protein
VAPLNNSSIAVTPPNKYNLKESKAEDSKGLLRLITVVTEIRKNKIKKTKPILYLAPFFDPPKK